MLGMLTAYFGLGFSGLGLLALSFRLSPVREIETLCSHLSSSSFRVDESHVIARMGRETAAVGSSISEQAADLMPYTSRRMSD